MEIRSISSPQNDPGLVAGWQPEGQVARPPAGPAIFDTSANEDANASASATGLAGGAQNLGSLNVNSQPIIVTDPAQAPHTDGTRDNVSTDFKLGTNGTPIHVASHVVPSSPHDSSQDSTAADVFWRGFKDGATHPGQTFGKISDMVSGDQSASGEKTGKKSMRYWNSCRLSAREYKLPAGSLARRSRMAPRCWQRRTFSRTRKKVPSRPGRPASLL
jgi:hypothetical protein